MNLAWFFGLVVLVAANANAQNLPSNDDIKNVWQFILDVLKYFAHIVHVDEDTGLNVTEFLTKYNYPLEEHPVTTEDNYTLTLHRIPHGRNETAATPNRPAVLLVHCLACSSMDWIWPGPDRALALLLADSGYDVWLANSRGNEYSMGHTTLNPKNSSYWDFSFYEKGFYDMKANVDFILEATGAGKITYIGHSQGTSAGIVLTSTRPEYNDKFNLMVLLSPIAYIKNASSPLVMLITQYQKIINLIFSILGIHGIPYSPTIGLLGSIFCNEKSSIQGLCIMLIDSFGGFDADQVDKSKLPVFLSNTPNGVSVKDIWHYLQLVDSGHFRQYDYGSVSNLVHYRKLTPPAFNISQITAPLAIYYAKNDLLSSIADVEHFVSELSQKPVVQHLVEYDYFNHLDFITAKDVKTLLYDSLIETIQIYAPIN